ncbi:urease accessory protein UreD [Advenella sp. S44]|uniref:urease accessory protein UreD n=1 Tax=Advenella sp. S44 TaxID=1982755 RepID=UPI001F5BA953|nr:urease accessory protein UreD [Advenella sp. S44]
MSAVMQTESWAATLSLAFSCQPSGRSALTHNAHTGPLLVQKSLYPEGPAICHATILHPPSGIAGGDELSIAATIHENAHAVLSTPGATRWYKANGGTATQRIELCIAPNAKLDWLPLENLLFEQAQASNTSVIRLAAGARAIGWDCFQLGSVATQGYWHKGKLAVDTALYYDDQLVWTEAGLIDAEHPVRQSSAGLGSFPVMATVWSIGPIIAAHHMESMTASLPWTDKLRAGVSQIQLDSSNSLVLVRLLGTRAEQIRQLMVDCWQRLRPQHLGVVAMPLRLWLT